jgi:hypothetical protein
MLDMSTLFKEVVVQSNKSIQCFFSIEHVRKGFYVAFDQELKTINLQYCT